MAFYDEKGWWKSKTIWTGLIATVYAILSLLGFAIPTGLDQGTVTEVFMGIFGVLAVIFRWQATSVLTSTKTDK
jgi:hypothetical protein